MPETAFWDTAAFLQLQRAYKHAEPDSFGLYLGAGVNLLPPQWKDTRKKRYEMYTWKQLLEALYEKNKERLTESFADLWDRYEDDWPGLASDLVGPLGVEALVDQIDDIIHGNIPRKDSYGRLSKRLLDQAPTLHAAICFSARIRERTKTSWTFERNPKIGTVVTFNYDFFFGAGWTRYQAFKKHWKVQTPFSEDEPGLEQRTISYLHGYVPYRFSALLRADHLNDPTRLALKLRDAPDPLSRYLRGQFPPDERRLLDEYDGASSPSKALKGALIRELNRLLEGECLYDEQRFAQLTLTEEIRRRIEQNPRGKDLVRLNRLLLEAAYPDEITKYRKERDIVLTRKSYRDAYASNGFAPRILQKAITRYNLIFLGISFSDKPLCDMLEKYRGKRQHFAIVKEDT
ncbi:MAG: hypothetical protein GTN71_09655, partial [Anaerolineae bacterium]|nr:hypothetical protein [Anaerolineae bacterium]